MDWIAEYRLYAMALCLNERQGHKRDAARCRKTMGVISEVGQLSPETTERIWEEVAIEVQESFELLDFWNRVLAH